VKIARKTDNPLDNPLDNLFLSCAFVDVCFCLGCNIPFC
jgi:hypothetical protein